MPSQVLVDELAIVLELDHLGFTINRVPADCQKLPGARMTFCRSASNVAFRTEVRGGTVADTESVKHIRWNDLPKEKLSNYIDRRMITGDKAMVTHVYLKKGAIVPMHHHVNEQLTYVLEGTLKFWIGTEDAEAIVVRSGEVLVLPSNVPHKAEALEDTLDVDFFTPPRQDWLDGTDDYLRHQ